MTDQNESTGSANIDTSSKDENSGTDSKKEDFVKYESFEKLLGQHKNSKSEADALRAEVTRMKAAEQKRQESKLAEQGEWQKIVELREAENKTLQEKILQVEAEKNQTTDVLINAQKLQAVCEKLPGRIKNSEYLSFIDLENVAFNPDTEQIDEASVQTAVNAFMDKHSGLVDTSHIGRLPANHAQTTTPLNHRFKDLSLKDMRINMKEAVQAAKKEMGI